MLTSQLRLRFLSTLAASGAIVGASLTACGGAVDTTGSSSGASGSSGTTGSSGTSGQSSSGQSSSGYSSSGTSGTPTPIPTPTSGPLPPETPSGTCKYGQPTTACYTHEQLVSQLVNPPFGGDATDAGEADADISGNFDANGCLPANLVQDGCCNAAVAGPTWSGASCCYVHCTGSCCGRPFVVAGEARVASICERDDWMADASSLAHAQDTELDLATRGRIATAWANDAAMEHASVASFAHFTLDLLALGAPADLVLGAQDATRDEIEHARACFSIASRYAGKNLGPDRLNVGGASPAKDLASAVAAAVVEGCIGETLSALLAEARLARAEDADVRDALSRIATEEARHAELAWSFVGWAITSGGEDIRDAAGRAFEAALATTPQSWDPSLHGVAPATLRAHGLLDEKAAREVALRAFADVIAPCADALTGRFATAA